MGCDLGRRGLVIGLATFIFSPSLAEAGSYLEFARGLAANPPDGASFRPDLEAEIAALLNAYRAEKRKRPVTPDPAFLEAARAHAADMMLNGFMGHTASTGANFQGRMRAFAGDITKYPSLGENAARDTQKTPPDQAKARALFQQWVESSSHRKNMLNGSFQFVSTGVIARGNAIWAVQIFFAAPRKKGILQ
ncbi:MAG: CAP domain-containing protein [Aestuariivirga sp.]|uniref:CAP domain-containing protein n=1 Tax=Aestuariivirga sp. TaxID=2650926 RepID=UPI0038D11DDD